MVASGHSLVALTPFQAIPWQANDCALNVLITKLYCCQNCTGESVHHPTHGSDRLASVKHLSFENTFIKAKGQGRMWLSRTSGLPRGPKILGSSEAPQTEEGTKFEEVFDYMAVWCQLGLHAVSKTPEQNQTGITGQLR